MSPVNTTSDRIAYEWERQFTALNHHAIVSVADADGDIIYINDRFCDISGYSREELLGQNHRVVKSDQHSPAFFRDMWRTIRAGDVWKGEVCNRRKDGSLYWVESTITPFMDPDGQPYQFVSIRTDITHLRAAQQWIEQQSRLQACLAEQARALLAVQEEDIWDAIGRALARIGAAFEADGCAVMGFEPVSGLECHAHWQHEPPGLIRPGCDTEVLQHCSAHTLALSLERLQHHLGEQCRLLASEVQLEGNAPLSLVLVLPAVQARWQELQGLLDLFADMLSNVLRRSAVHRELVRFKERLRCGQMYANIGTWEWNLMTDEVYWSEKVVTLFGYPEGQAISASYQAFIDRVHPEDVPHVEAAIRDSLTTDEPYEIEHRVLLPDGRERWLLERGAVVRNERGMAQRMIGVVQDIDEKKKARIRLEQSERELRQAQQLAHIGNWSVDYRSGALNWSAEVYRIFGHSPDTFAPSLEAFRAQVHTEDLEGLLAREQASAAVGRYDLIHRIRRPDGSVRHVHELGEPVLDEQGQLIGMAGTVQDITDRVEAYARLRETEERFAFAVEGAGDGVWDWDLRSGEVSCSPLYMEMLGFRAEDRAAYMDHWSDNIHPDDLRPARARVTRYLEGKTDRYEVQMRLRCRDNSWKWVLCRGQVVERDDSGAPLRMIGINSDISRTKATEEALIGARNEAERASRAKSEFLSGMSHELRTPMNAILGFGQLMEFDSQLPREHQESVHEILKAGRHLLDLINDVLDLARVESGKMELSLEPVDLGSLMAECVSLIAPLAAKVQVSLQYDDLAGISARADRTRLKQVIINLMSNGVKYNRPQGRLHISLSAPQPERIRLAFADTGVGISPAGLEQLFQPFNRLDADQTCIEGTGIGLTLTQKMIHLMEGDIGVHSQPGVGSTFWIELPSDTLDTGAVEPSAQAAAWDMSEPEQGHKQVLYIDDNPANLKLVRNLIARLPGVRLLDAHTPELGLELAKRHLPDLILLDINMPGLNGYQVLEIIRRNPAFADTPVVALTANAMPRDVEHGRRAGFSDYLTKPLDIPAFMTMLQQRLAL